MTSKELDAATLPRHIAIIMDGNGRWAQERKLVRTMGHKVGVESVQKIVTECCRLKIDVLTLYAFSTENWKRPALEVKTLMALLKSYLQKELATILNNNIRLRCIGQIEKLPTDVQDILQHAMAESAQKSGMVLNLALSYGSRDEIVRAVRHIADQCLAGTITPQEIEAATLEKYLYTSGLPDPDLLIRTGGESRLSNFLLWQASYAEIYITETHWPDFREESLHLALADFQKRQRRFGKTGEQVQDAQ